jgi:16S rRNA (guanine966-N2)-methyltransferase
MKKRMHGRLRIIAGRDRGRRLDSPPDSRIRPTAGIAREAVFNILQDRIEDSRFLDLYAGTGSVGLEALSRGAGSVTFVERDGRGMSLLLRNIAKMSRAADCVPISSSAPEQCRALAAEGKKFDIVFIDPPYSSPGIPLGKVEPLLASDGVVLYQKPVKDAVGNPFDATRLVRIDSRRYGRIEVTFWAFPEEPANGEQP